MAVFLLRHTRTVVPESICYGTQDVDLHECFDEEVAAIETPSFDTLWSSPLSRCVKLAERLAEKSELKVQTDLRLLEMNFGNWQGKSWSNINRNEIDAWASNFEEYKGHGGESVLELRQRTQSFLSELDLSQTTMIVTHSGVIRSAMALRDDSDERQIKVAYGELIQLH